MKYTYLVAYHAQKGNEVIDANSVIVSEIKINSEARVEELINTIMQKDGYEATQITSLMLLKRSFFWPHGTK